MTGERGARQESLVRAQFERHSANPGEALYHAHRAIALDALRQAVSLPDDLLAVAVIVRAAEAYAYFAAVANGPDHPSALGPRAAEEFNEFINDVDTLCAYAQFVWEELPEPLRLRHPGLPDIIAAEHEWLGEAFSGLTKDWDGESPLMVPAEVFVRVLRLMATVMGCWLDEADQARFVADLTRGAGVIGEWRPLLHADDGGLKN